MASIAETQTKKKEKNRRRERQRTQFGREPEGLGEGPNWRVRHGVRVGTETPATDSAKESEN